LSPDPRSAASPEALFAAALASEPSRPMITFYDDASGEWAELSARSLANWVAKTHFLLMDGLGLGVGDAAFVDLPAHWISVPVLLGCWSAGLTVVTAPAQAAVAFVEPVTLARAGDAGVPDVFAIAPASAARGFGADVPAGAEDYVVAVRPQPDAWGSVHSPAGPADSAIDDRSRADVVASAAARAQGFGLSAGGRVLSTRAWAGADDWIDTLLAPLSVGASIVLVAHAADDADGDAAAKHEARIRQERVTAVI
jgi:uncharacterized protein (TIGR03089 family)